MCFTGFKSNVSPCLLGVMLVPGAAAAADPGRFLPSESATGAFSRMQEHKHSAFSPALEQQGEPCRVGDIWPGALKGEYEFARSEAGS